MLPLQPWPYATHLSLRIDFRRLADELSKVFDGAERGSRDERRHR
jgi:hypothetical protein